MELKMIHKFELNGYKLVIDVNSGSVHILDGITYDLLNYASDDMPAKMPQEALKELTLKYSDDDLIDAWTELYTLYKSDVLFSTEVYQKYNIVNDNGPIKSICLNIAHDCNLRCTYCFASTGDFGGGRKLMTFEVGKAAIDFLLKNCGSRRNLEVDFFGGEPLMNFDVVKEIVRYSRAAEKVKNKNIRFTITTNALLLDVEKIDFINSEMSNVVLSLDGRREVNDLLRKTISGDGSYDLIVPKIKLLVEKRKQKNYYVRGTFTRENLDFTGDVLHLAELGFEQISVEPVITDDSNDLSIRKEDLPQVFAEYEKLSKEIIKLKKEGKGFNFFHFMIDLEEGPCLIKLLRGCGCGNEYVAITPEGDIYPCHQFVGQNDYIMGNVMNEGEKLTAISIKKDFSHANIFAKKDCTKCWAKFYCSGGCNANNNAFCGDILKPYSISCEIEKKRVECALMIKAALSD
jgi:uncharacterized protein